MSDYEIVGPFDKASDFLDALTKSQSHLDHQEEHIGFPRTIYRGQERAEWGLAPHIFRQGFNWDKYVTTSNQTIWGGSADPKEENSIRRTELYHNWLKNETRAIMHFLRAADDLALLKEVDFSAIEAHFGAHIDEFMRSAEPVYQVGPFPAPEIVDYIAAAQHYGVPTRLLDWTESPLIAAFFAGYRAWRFRNVYENYEVNEGPGIATTFKPIELSPDHTIAVFCADIMMFDFAGSRMHTGKYLPHVIRTSRTSNSFLRAQRGLFVNLPFANTIYISWRRWPDFKEYFDAWAQEHKRDFKVKKFTLKAACCSDLLRLLSERDVTPVTVMPTLQNAAKMSWYRRVLRYADPTPPKPQRIVKLTE